MAKLPHIHVTPTATTTTICTNASGGACAYVEFLAVDISGYLDIKFVPQVENP